MSRRHLLVIVTAFLLTACGSDPLTIKLINSNNGEPLIEFAYTSYESLYSFMQIGELQVIDGTGFCKEVDGVTGSATVPPAAPAPGDVFVVAFADCVDEYGITYNNSMQVTVNAFTDWSNLSFTLEFIDLTAGAEWFGGVAAYQGTLDYEVAGNTGNIASTRFEAAVPDGIMGSLALTSLDITVTEDEDNPEILISTYNGAGETSSTQAGTLAISILTASDIRQDSSNDTLLCPQSGRVRLISNADDSYASIEFPGDINNVYRIGTNLSFTQNSCT
ncbi:MAG: hypothetical protein P8Z78_05785 [Gammaproteobacteria bacterium]|jgi:hypothetical protein